MSLKFSGFRLVEAVAAIGRAKENPIEVRWQVARARPHGRAIASLRFTDHFGAGRARTNRGIVGAAVVHYAHERRAPTPPIRYRARDTRLLVERGHDDDGARKKNRSGRGRAGVEMHREMRRRMAALIPSQRISQRVRLSLPGAPAPLAFVGVGE